MFRGSHPLRSFIFLLAIVTLVGVHAPKICREVVICFHLKCQNFGNNRALAAKKLVVVCSGKFQHRTNVPRSDAHTTSTLPPVALKFKKICRQHVHVYLCTFTLPKFWLSDLLSPDVRLVTFANILAIFANRLALKYFCQSIGIFANILAILMSVRPRCAHVWLCFWAGSAWMQRFARTCPTGGFSIFLTFSAMNPPAESNQLLWLKDIEYNTHYKTCENLAKELKQLHFLRYFYVTCYNSSIAQPVVIKAASIDDHNALCKLGNKNSKDFQEFLGRIKYNSNGITEFQITEVCVCGKGTKAALLNKTFTAYCCDAFVSEFIKYSDAFR